MAPAEDATSPNPSARIRKHPTWLKILFFPVYLLCFAACWSTSGGEALRVAKWLGTSLATSAATTTITYTTTLWLVPALQRCQSRVPSITTNPTTQQPYNLDFGERRGTWTNMHKREARETPSLPTPARHDPHEEENLNLLSNKKTLIRHLPASQSTQTAPPNLILLLLQLLLLLLLLNGYGQANARTRNLE